MNLKRMEELLNKGGNTTEPAITRDSDNDTIQEAMDIEGYSVGFSGSSNQIEKVLKEFSNELQKAKGIYLKFIVNENLEDSTIGTVMEDINQAIAENISIIMETNIDNSISPSEYRFQILLTGL
jgi:cell division GTPase FtsZ